MRNSGRLDVLWFYNYFKDQGGKGTFGDFQMAFNFMSLSEVVDFLDGKFEIIKLEYSDGRLIKIL